jgi:hypothetical protein
MLLGLLANGEFTFKQLLSLFYQLFDWLPFLCGKQAFTRLIFKLIKNISSFVRIYIF